MKIGIDARLWNQTGVGRYIRNLVLNLQEIDKENEYVLFVRTEDEKDVKLLISNFKFKILNCDIKWHTIKEQFIFARILKKQNLDLVHFPYYSVPVFYNKPFVVTLHDLIPLHFQTGKSSTLPFPFYKFKFFAYRFVVNHAAKSAKKIIAPSNTTRREIKDYLKVSDSKIVVIYEGVDDKLLTRKNVKKEEFILYVGNAYPHKNLEIVLSAIKRTKNIKLVFVGKEDYFYRRIKYEANKMGLENKTQFKGEVSDGELSSLYKRAKAVIVPSLLEGFGLPVLEGMANGCLVLCSDIPVLHEVGGNAAIYFNPKDSMELSKKIDDIYSNYSKYEKDIKNGFERVKLFSWGKTARETLKLYENSVL